ncbi:succinate dehydrogenase/fumarate reductase flavoprotein subunit [Rhodococcus sp. SMB37]|uniref:3-ketosteroid-delta-1-dehydrogenase n=1 Tax=Rhodococcus sp. SMB37 TaxID=2512213 RepID=UPI0010497626|nr:3-ketosteroid-delta-1-dehydrogenase [Rhodococcus sp. SMB37]TCN49240.1 succinate dehydrogenase/fumarate reductase flavoprotein subunit [Rhodococcus sp. SMB37]
MAKRAVPPLTPAHDTTVDLLVIGSGTGMAAALSAKELGLSSLIIEKTKYVGGSTARSGGAFWMPANPVLKQARTGDTEERGRTYVRAVVDGTAPVERGDAFVDNGAETVAMLQRTTPMKFFWAEGYSDYHPEKPGGAAVGRTCECRPFNLSQLGEERGRLRPGLMDAGLPMPTTGADYKWMNLMVRTPVKGFSRIFRRLAQGVAGLAIKREYVAGGQAIAAGLFAGVLNAKIPVWTETSLVRLLEDGGRVTGAVLEQNGREVTVTARRGVVLAAGGFDHDMAWRHKFQSESLAEGESLGAEGNTGDAIKIAQEIGAGVDLMDQAWWFPAVAPTKAGRAPLVMLAERSLPGSFIVDQTGRRFTNESSDYMSFGQLVLERERTGDPVESMWIVFDQKYRNSYMFAAGLFPRQPIPGSWYKAGIAHQGASATELAESMGVPVDAFTEQFRRFNDDAAAGTDSEFSRGGSAYDRYYGDPTVEPNPNLRPLDQGPYFAVKMTLSDLGTCGGLRADERGRVLREDGDVIDGLYAVGNTAANAFGDKYPGAGATIGQGLVYGYIAAHDAANSTVSS